MADIYLHDADESLEIIEFSVGCWIPDSGGILLSIAWSKYDLDKRIEIFLSASDALWLMARLPEALEVRLRDGEYWADLNERQPIPIDSPSGLGSFFSQWRDNNEKTHPQEIR